jgi:hypothetical protein
MNPKFILKEDMVIKIPGMTKDIKLFDKGKIFESNENNEYVIEMMGGTQILTEDKMREAVDQDGNLLFDIVQEEPVEQDLDIIVEEIPDDDDEQVKRWRIQLDVTTTRKKLKEIEKFVNENVKKLL